LLGFRPTHAFDATHSSHRTKNWTGQTISILKIKFLF
jgi:hypothetical protein